MGVTAFFCTRSNAQPSWALGAPGKTLLCCLALFICVHVGLGWEAWGLSLALGWGGLDMAAGWPSCVGLG